MFALVRAPLAVLLIALTLAFGSAALVVMALLDQPWLGIDIRQGGRIVTAVEGPAAALPPGSTLLSLRSPEGGAALVLDDFDTVEEPDTLPRLRGCAGTAACCRAAGLRRGLPRR